MFDKLLIENILRRPHSFDWQVQGLGMLRVYLDDAKRYRLHIWDSSLRVPGVSPMHNHPWDLKSTVIAGVYKQHRFTEPNNYINQSEEFNKVTIKCGEGAKCTSDVEKVRLCRLGIEEYPEGSSYTQAANEIHLSLPDDGTVTLVERTPKDDPDHACVYWRGKGPWVTAEPRQPTKAEVIDVTARALDFWF